MKRVCLVCRVFIFDHIIDFALYLESISLHPSPRRSSNFWDWDNCTTECSWSL